jgi:putative acetyltransferase
MGLPAGCAGLVPRPGPQPTAEIKRLYVRPARRGQGIARALMSQAHHHAPQHGMTRLVLKVLPGRTGAIGFCRRLGYSQTGPYTTESSVPMIYMQRRVPDRDVRTPCPAPGGRPGGRWPRPPGRTG